ncbi:MAG: substrate-binding domain-containing protein [Rhodospirillales bacterium]
MRDNQRTDALWLRGDDFVERCQGFADGLGVKLGKQMIDSNQELPEIKTQGLAYLSANPKTDAILTLGPISAYPTIETLNENGMAGDIYFGTFDLGTETVKDINAGIINWEIDQQPFLQVYLLVVVLTNYDRYGVIP